MDLQNKPYLTFPGKVEGFSRTLMLCHFGIYNLHGNNMHFPLTLLVLMDCCCVLSNLYPPLTTYYMMRVLTFRYSVKVSHAVDDGQKR